MYTKGPPPIELLSKHLSSPIAEAYFEINQLKQLYRQGWLQRGVPAERCESVAEHIFGVTLLALAIAGSIGQELDAARLIRMALLHDIGEAYAGDITPADGVTAETKHALERQAVVRILEKLPHGDEYIALWEEYEARESPESRLVHQLDCLEMALQASIYDQQGLLDPSDFYASASRCIEDAGLAALLAEIKTLKP